MRKILLHFLLLAPLCAKGQEPQKPLRKFVVCDIETRVPIRDAIVWTKDGYRDTTNYRGICYIPEQFDTLSVYKANYLTERLLLKEAKDSTFLIPNNKRISEVTIWGKDGTKGPVMDFGKAIREGMAEDAASKAAFNLPFDFAKMLDKRYRRDQKHLVKMRKSFKQMDTYDEDPIVNAYKKTLEEKRIANERARAEQERTEQARQTEQGVPDSQKKAPEPQKEEAGSK